MSEERHELVIRDLDNRLTKIEVLLEERNRKSDEMMAKIIAIDTKLDNLPEHYITRREFDAKMAGLEGTSDAKHDGVKAWQGLVFALVMLALTVIMNWNN
jgi:hypothetical protein